MTTRERIILERFGTMPYDDGLPKYKVTRIDGNGKLATENRYTDVKVGIFHVLMHESLNYYVNPPKLIDAQPIGVCFRKKTADKKLYEAARARGMELEDKKLGFLEELTDGKLRTRRTTQ
jgi:hypothetical protein